MNIAIVIVGTPLLGLFLWKVSWPQMRDGFVQLRSSERQLGPGKFWALMAATAAFIGLFVWLVVRLNYPDAYGHPCHGRGCLMHDIWFSPLLLKTHHWDEVLLFVCFSIVPAALVVAGIAALVKKWKSGELS